MSYYVVAVLCVFSMVIGILGFKENEMISIRRKRCFVILAWIVIAEIVLDTIALTVDGNPVIPVVLYRILKAIEFSLAPVIPAMFSMIITRKSFWIRIRTLFAVLVGINAILQFVSLFLPIMFEITNDLHYVRTVMTYAYLIDIFFGCIILVISSRHMALQNTENMSATLILLICLVIAGVVLRIFLKDCNSDWLTVTIAYFTITIYFNNNHSKVDSSTGLLNRNAFNHRFEGIEKKYSTAFIFIDANCLKKINDTEGHGKGDWLLSRIADCVLEVYGKDGFCYRYGGDEFVVILKPRVIRKSTEDVVYVDKNAMIEKMMARLDKMLKKALETTEGQKETFYYGVAQGYGIYYIMEDKPAEIDYITAEEALKLADGRMYENKQKYKQYLNQEDSENQEQSLI